MLAAERLPFGNMYEFVMTITLLGTAIWLGTLFFQRQVRHLGLFVMLFEVLLVGVAGMVLLHAGRAAGPGAGLVLVRRPRRRRDHVVRPVHGRRRGFDHVPGPQRLRRRQAQRPLPFGRLLANAEAVERLSFRLHAFAFPIWTFGVTAGAIWAEVAWGRYWGWDPKEVWAFISWVVYAGYLHARATPSVSSARRPGSPSSASLTMMMNLFGVNIFFSGLHSYGGV